MLIRPRLGIDLAHLPIALCCLLQAQPGSVVRLYPVDDTARDPAFKSFVGRLRSAVVARNAEALRKLVDPAVILGPGDDDKGWTSFTTRWRPEDRENSPVWDVLSNLLSLGFIREQPSLYLSPYLVWRFPTDLDMRKYMVVVRDGAVLREAPSASARPVALLSFDIVQRLGPPGRGQELGEWTPVRTLDGKTGYLKAREVMSPSIPRAQFGRRRGRWVLVALESGDQ